MKLNNLQNIVIDIGQITESLSSLAERVEIPIEIRNFDCNAAENVNPFYDILLDTTETMLISSIPHADDLIIAPGEPMSIFMAEKCEEFVILSNFPLEPLDTTRMRYVKLIQFKYFN